METMERDRTIIESRQIHARFSRALSSYDKHADAQHRISRQLAVLLLQYRGSSFRRILEIGCGTGGFTRYLYKYCKGNEWLLNDLCEGSQELINQSFSEDPHTPLFMAGDAEILAFPGPFDLIASASVFQWMKQPETFLQKLAGLLTPDGTLLFSTFAPGNLEEIRELTGIGLTYPTTEQLKKWLTPYFHLLDMEEETITLTFPTPLEVLRHLKNTGVTANGNSSWTRGLQEKFVSRYQELYRTKNNQVTLTYRPLYVVAVKK